MHGRLRELGLGIVLGFLIPTGGAAAESRPAIPWLTGTSAHLQLGVVVANVYWSDAPLRQAVISLSRIHRVAVLIDRRVDPDQRLELTITNVPLEGVFQRIAEARGLGIAVLGSVVYLGPPAPASRLRTLSALRHDELGKLPPEIARRFLATERLRWNDFATPRELLAQLAQAGGFEFVGLEQVPHDLWAGADLPPLPLVDRIALVAIQFDLTLEVNEDGSRVTLVPVPDDVSITKEYAGGPQPEQLAEQWAASVPESEVRAVGGKILVRGPVEDHEKLAGSRSAVAPTSSKSAGPRQGETRYTVKANQKPLGPVLKELAAKLNLELQIDEQALEAAGISLDQPVSFNVKDATVEGLFRAVLTPARCTFRRQGKVIEVFAVVSKQ
jgi:hypothetical protein